MQERSDHLNECAGEECLPEGECAGEEYPPECECSRIGQFNSFLMLLCGDLGVVVGSESVRRQ